MVFNEPWQNGFNLCAIVKEGHATLTINPYPSYILDPMPSVKVIWIQEGSLCLAFYVLGVPSWGSFSVVTFP